MRHGMRETKRFSATSAETFEELYITPGPSRFSVQPHLKSGMSHIHHTLFSTPISPIPIDTKTRYRVLSREPCRKQDKCACPKRDIWLRGKPPAFQCADEVRRLIDTKCSPVNLCVCIIHSVIAPKCKSAALGQQLRCKM